MAPIVEVLKALRDELADGPRAKELLLTIGSLTTLADDLAGHIATTHDWRAMIVANGLPTTAGGHVEETECFYCGLEEPANLPISDHWKTCLWRQANEGGKA